MLQLVELPRRVAASAGLLSEDELYGAHAPAIVPMLSALDAHATSLARHLRMTAMWSSRIAAVLGLVRRKREEIATCGALHDFVSIVPHGGGECELRNAQRNAAAVERNPILRERGFGTTIVLAAGTLSSAAPIESRIIATADRVAWELQAAIVSGRPRHAIETIRSARGVTLDATCVDIALGLLGL